MSERMETSQESRASIRGTILGFSLMLVLVAVSLVGGAAGFFASRTVRQGIRSQVAAVADLKEGEITRWVSEREGDLAVLATEQALREQWQTLLEMPDEDPAYVNAYSDLAVRLNAFLRKKVAFVDISLLNAETGQILVSTEVLREREYHASAPFFLRGQEGIYVEAVELDPVLNIPTLLLSRPVEDINGEVIAVLVGRANFADLSTVLGAEIGLGGASKTYLLSENGIYLAGSLEAGTDVEGMTGTLGFQQASQGVEETNTYVNYRDVEVVGAYRWVTPPRVALMIEVPRAVETQSVSFVTTSSMGVALLAGVVAVGLATLLSRRIVRPITDLTEAAVEIAAGDLDRRAPVEREDEVGVLARAFNAMTERLQDLVSNLEQRVASRTEDAERRARQIQLASELSATIAAIRDLDELLAAVTQQVSEQFGFYHVGVFLLDERGEHAVLRAANSPGGIRMLNRGHRLRVGEEGIVGYTAATKEPRIALDVGEDAVFFNNPDLPATRSEMALPLVVGDSLVGVLDVQSQEGGAFTEEDITILQGLAGQLAVSLENARLFAESEQAVQAMRRAYGEAGRESWKRLIRHSGQLRYRGTPQGVMHVESGADAAMIQTTQVEGPELVVPLKVRRQVIGGFRVSKPDAGGTWTSEEITLVESLVEQLGVALESARLYEDTQRRATRERLLGEMTARFTQSLDLDAVLQAAVQELGQLPGVVQASVHVGASQKTDGNGAAEIEPGPDGLTEDSS